MKPRKSMVIVSVVSALGLAYAASASTLFVPDSDTSTLAAIFATGLEELATLNQELGEAQKTYSQAKTLVGYGADVKNGFTALVTLDFNSLEQLFIKAVPNAAFIDREARGGYSSWGQGTGDLQLMISACLNSKNAQAGAVVPPQGSTPPPTSSDPCALLESRLSGQQLSASLQVLFPPGTTTPVLAQPTLDASTRADQQEVRDVLRQQKVASLSALCQDPLTADPDKCNAASKAAELLTAAQLAELIDRMVDLNRIEAVQLAMHVSEQSAQQQRDDDRRKLLLDAAGQVAPAPLQLRAPGFTFTE